MKSKYSSYISTVIPISRIWLASIIHCVSLSLCLNYPFHDICLFLYPLKTSENLWINEQRKQYGVKKNFWTEWKSFHCINDSPKAHFWWMCHILQKTCKEKSMPNMFSGFFSEIRKAILLHSTASVLKTQRLYQVPANICNGQHLPMVTKLSIVDVCGEPGHTSETEIKFVRNQFCALSCG